MRLLAICYVDPARKCQPSKKLPAGEPSGCRSAVAVPPAIGSTACCRSAVAVPPAIGSTACYRSAVAVPPAIGSTACYRSAVAVPPAIGNSYLLDKELPEATILLLLRL
jgi:hypothetical protein